MRCTSFAQTGVDAARAGAALHTDTPQPKPCAMCRVNSFQNHSKTMSHALTNCQESAAPSLFAQAMPARDLPAFYALQDRNQERIKLLLQAFESIRKAPTLELGYDMAAAQLSGLRGTSASRLRTLYAEWRKTHDWRCLIDGALEWRPNVAMPRDFTEHLNSLADNNPRSVAAALKSLRRDWITGKSIPGIGTWQEHFQRAHPGRALPRLAPPHPQGWTVRNLRRYIDTSKFRRTAATQGRIAATAHRQTVLGTREGLWVHSHLMWDDVWHDLFVNSFAEKQAGRPLELFAHDYYSARKVRYGLRVRTEDDNGKAHGLTGKMMRMITAAVFYLDGYSPRGTVNLAEHGTAAFSEAMERTLSDATGGLITVERSGMLGKAAHLGQYNGRRTGNPRFKASLESSNNLLHNLEAHLPGQTGPDRQRRPEQLDGLLSYNDRLLAAYQQLPASKAALLEFPLLELGQYQSVLSEIYSFMESDHDHDLQGWIECGHIMQEMHLIGEWRSQDEIMRLPSGQRETALAMLGAGALQTRPRKMSRREVWQRGAADLITIHGGTVCELLGDDFAAERKVRAHQFIFEDAEVGPGEHRFEGIITDAEGAERALKDGETYKAFVNPFAADQLFVQDAKGRFLGTARRILRASRTDMDGLARAMGRAAHVESELLKPLAKRNAEQARKKLAMHRNNSGVIASEETAKAKASRKASTALSRSLEITPFAPASDAEPEW